MTPESLPQDPAILQSYLNTLLRDYYPSLEELCHARNIDLPLLIEKLGESGLEYNAELNKIW